MAATPIISPTAAKAGLDAICAKLNTSGVIKVFTGSAPSHTGAADTGTLLVTLTLSTTAFAASTDGTTTGIMTATANAITSGTAAASGTAGYFRAYDGSVVCHIQGSCGTSAADMILNSTTITSGDVVAATSWVVTLPDGSGND